jgi:hypothetical protein
MFRFYETWRLVLFIILLSFAKSNGNTEGDLGDFGPGDFGPGDFGPGDFGPGDFGSGNFFYYSKI